jgi:hypothetical protein
LVVPLLVLIAGCSGGSHPTALSSTTPVATSSTPGVTTSASSTPTAGTRPSSSATAATAPPATAPPSAKTSSSGSPHASPSEIPLNASLSKSCVVPGSEQTLTIHSRPKMSVIFDTLYPDQKDGQAYAGIDAHGRTDAAGSYVNTWTVSPAAPTGTAKVNAAAITDDGRATGHQILPFKIALHC